MHQSRVKPMFIAATIMAVAAAILPVSVLAASTSMGQAASNLLHPTSIATKLVDLTCYVMGVAFIFMAFAQYKIHRQSPKLVPLTTPLLLLFLGGVALLIPYATKLTETGKVESQSLHKPSTLPLPETEPKKGLGLPYSPASQKPSSPSATPPNNEKDSETGPGHWTQDPRYK